MRELSTWENLIFRLGAILMLTGLVVRMFDTRLALYVFGLGTMFFCLMRLRAQYEGNNFTIRRLRRQQIMASLFFILTLVGLSMQEFNYGPFRRNEWMVALAIGCVLEFYTAWRIPSELEKLNNS